MSLEELGSKGSVVCLPNHGEAEARANGRSSMEVL